MTSSPGNKTITTNSTMQTETIPPIVHAIGGSIGSTLSMLLLYPLERIRIEMQAMASSEADDGAMMGANDNSGSLSSSSSGSNRPGEDRDCLNNTDSRIKSRNNGIGKKSSQDMDPTSPSSEIVVVEGGREPMDHVDDGILEQGHESLSSSSAVGIGDGSGSDNSDEWIVHIYGDNATGSGSGSGSGSGTNVSIPSAESLVQAERLRPNDNIENITPSTTTTAIIASHDDGPNDKQLSSSSSSTSQISLSTKNRATNTTLQQHSFTTTHIENDGNDRQKRFGLWMTFLMLRQKNQLYKGAQPVALTLALSNFVFFYALQALKKIELRRLLSNSKAKTSKAGGASILTFSIAGVINVLLTNPLWVANLRLVRGSECNSMDESRGLFSTVRHIAANEGIGQLWSGTWASLLLVSNPTIQYYVYEKIKTDLLTRRSEWRSNGRSAKGVGSTGGQGMLSDVVSPISLGPLEAFVMGALAKGLATVLTYPLQLAQVLLRLQNNQVCCSRVVRASRGSCGNGNGNGNGNDSDTGISSPSPPMNKFSISSALSPSQQPSYEGTLNCLIQLFQNGGIRALYSGMNAKLLQTVLTAAFTFLTYEQIVSVVSRSYKTVVLRNRLS